ncbi:MAG: hypothetical protein ACM3JP_00980 [Betaproteobacteria bacterium]
MTRIRVVSILAIAVWGCGQQSTRTGPPESPLGGNVSGPPILGVDWGRAPSVERPTNYAETVPPSYTGTHPILRIPGQAYMEDVVGVPGGGFVSVGYVPPDWQPAAWTSPDALTWSIHAMGTTDFTFPVALAVGADGTVVAVGRSGKAPMSWTSTDGTTWTEHAVSVLAGTAAERMNAVVAGSRGYVAGGSAGPELADRHAWFWTSEDGSDWRPVADDAATFANSEVRAIASSADGFVAVGVVGDAQHPTGAVAWTSSDGRRWTRVDDSAFDGGVAVSVVAAPFGGFIAVGSDLDRKEAVVWTSQDGGHWTRAPTEASRRYPGDYVWMTDVASVDDRVIGVGVFQGLQRGTATSWTSRDGMTWERARIAPSQEGSEFYAITAGGPGAIVVGAYGAPDSYVPEAWLTPAR